MLPFWVFPIPEATGICYLSKASKDFKLCFSGPSLENLDSNVSLSVILDFCPFPFYSLGLKTLVKCGGFLLGSLGAVGGVHPLLWIPDDLA